MVVLSLMHAERAALAAQVGTLVGVAAVPALAREIGHKGETKSRAGIVPAGRGFLLAASPGAPRAFVRASLPPLPGVRPRRLFS